MSKRFVLSTLFASCAAAVASAQVTVTYEPTTIQAGLPTDVTIGIMDSSGAGVEIGSIALEIEHSDGLTLNAFSWIVPEFEDVGLWFVSDMLPAPAAVAFGAGLLIGPDQTLAIATATLTAASGAAGTTQTLTPSPNVTLGDAAQTTIEILSGTSVELAISGSADGGGGSGGDSGVPPSGEGDAGGGETGDDPADASDDGTDTTMDGGQGTDDSHPDEGETVDGGNGSGDVGDADDDGTTPVVGDDTTGDDTIGEDGTDGANDDATTSGGSNAAPPFCGVGMIGPGLFTLCCLSVMKVHRRPRW